MSRKIYILFVFFCFISCARDKTEDVSYDLIAHAGGSIDGHIYTNSVDAVARAIDNGYRFIELDLSFTADSILVASHAWSDFNKMSGNKENDAHIPTAEEFRNAKLHGKYRTMDAYEIDSVFKANKNLFFVTDKISDADVLERHFPDIKDRMVVEAFSYHDYVQLKRRGFYRVLYSCLAEDMVSVVLKHLLFHRLFPGEKVEWIALDTSAFDNGFFKFMNSVCDFNIALFTVNDTNVIPAKYLPKIKMIYTDSIIPLRH